MGSCEALTQQNAGHFATDYGLRDTPYRVVFRMIFSRTCSVTKLGALLRSLANLGALRQLAAFAALAAVVGATVGCADDGPLKKPADLDETRDSAPPPKETVACDPGEERECSVTVRQPNDLISCFKGVQYCEDDGTWSQCVEGELALESGLDRKKDRELAAYLPSKGLQALTNLTPTDCHDSCDPGCLTLVHPAPAPGGSGYQGGGQAVSCAHDVCTVDDDSPLVAACCSPGDNNCCIPKVCAKDASCCTTGWDQDCVNLMYTECLGRPPPFSLCDFGVYGQDALTTANRPSAGAAMGSKGKITMGTDGAPSMIVAGGDLDIKSPNGKNITTPGGVWVGGKVTAENGGGAKYTGDWNVGGTINLTGNNTIVGKVNARGAISNATINGDAKSGGTFTNVTGTGTRTSNSNHPAPVIQMPVSLPSLPTTCPGGTNYVVDTSPVTVLTLQPGNYGNLEMRNGVKVTLDGPGTYTFKKLDAIMLTSGGLQIGKNATAGVYTVVVCGDVTFGNNMFIINHTGNAASAADKPLLVDPGRFVLYAGGLNNRIDTNAQFVGVLIAPNGKVTVADRATIKGAIWAKSFQAGTDMAALGISKAACEALNIPNTGPAVNMCSITTVIQAPLTIDEYQYKANCPVATTARWKTLTWASTVPAGSQIEFKAKVAASEAALANATYTSVGVAKTTPTNTTTCSGTGPAPMCPVALTSKLNLGTHQGQYLALRIERDSTGGMPAIQDFKVNYTCVFAE